MAETASRRKTLVGGFAAGGVALATVIALVVATTNSRPPVIHLAGTGAQPEAASDARVSEDALVWPAVELTFELADSARFGVGEAPVWRLEPPRDVGRAASDLAARFGLDAATQSPYGDGSWQAGSSDGFGPSLWVAGNGSWYYTGTHGIVEWACAEPAFRGDADTSDADDLPPPPEPEPCPEPTPPEGVPSADEARRLAESLLADLALPAAPRIVDVRADEWGAWVTATIPLDGRPTDVFATVGYGEGGAIVSANGMLGRAVRVADYPTVDAETAVERLSGDRPWLGYGTRPAAAARDVAVDPDEPVSAPAEPVVDPVEPAEPVQPVEPHVDDDEAAILPVPEPTGTPEPVTVRLVSAEPYFMTFFDAAETLWLLPAVRFVDDGGGAWAAMLVADGFVEFAEPPPSPEPLPVDPPDQIEPPGTKPGDSGGGSDGVEPVDGYDDLAHEVIGLTEDEAAARIAAAGAEVRVVYRDGEHFPVTDDHRPDRLNLYVEDGVVVRAYAG